MSKIEKALTHVVLIAACHFLLPEPIGIAIHLAFLLDELIQVVERRFFQ